MNGDLLQGWRVLRRNPGFALVGTLTLALGIGANTAIFSVVEAVLLRPLPYAQPDRLVRLWSTFVDQGIPSSGSALPDYREWRERTDVFSGLGAFFYGDLTLSGDGGDPERVQAALVTANLLDVLGVTPALGRGFRPEEEQVGRNGVVVLSHALWQRRFGGDPAIVGRTLSFGDGRRRVVGVLPEGWPFLDDVPPVELFAPFAFALDDAMATRENHFLSVVGRLAPGVDLAAARAAVSLSATRIAATHTHDAGMDARVIPLQEALAGESRRALWILLGAVGCVLLVACVNVANLLLARGAARARELSIRISLGAGRARLVRQLLVEGLPLGLIGGLGGVLLGVWGVDLLVSLLPVDVPRYNPIGVDAPVLAFSAGLTLLTVLVFGLAPAWQAGRVDPRDGLVDGGRALGPGRKRHRALGALVTIELALALVLSSGAGLMLRSFERLRRVDAGAAPQNVLTMSLPLSAVKYPRPVEARALFDRLLERVRALPGVRSAGVTTVLPLGYGSGWGKWFSIEGRPAPASVAQVPVVMFALVSEGYLPAAGIALRRGRAFTPHDTAEGEQVAVINETLARRFFANDDPLGRVIYMGPPESLQPPSDPELGGRQVRR
ncbi:MAG TPA: ABC transporter permease, partial [Candidatus Polarisedimenticolaceae bacterium]|nr:ABC transporter permease [Candidatus Polarisedimenticolaceae bacterium]